MSMVVALGGHALFRPSDGGQHTRQRERAVEAAQVLADLVDARLGPLVVVHGNGPQVGIELLRSEAAAQVVPALPLHACVAKTQATMGHALVLALREALVRRGRQPRVTCLVTHVRVEAGTGDRKPVGPSYDASEAAKLASERGWDLRPDPGRGMRRNVPSPLPLEVLELAAVKALLGDHEVVLAGGGGGIPVTGAPGLEQGFDAVVDKDYTATLLALMVGAERILNLTAVDAVYRGFASTSPARLDVLGVETSRRLLEEGEFAEGSMAPKIRAALQFLSGGGREVVITDPAHALAAMQGRGGTRIS